MSFFWTFGGVVDAVILGGLLLVLVVCGSILMVQNAWRKARRALKRRLAK
ncbi:hypothetical protein ACLBXO_16320 [Methylobacterium sp. C33D]